jgi:hypothetical protein
MQGCLETDAARRASDQDDPPRERLGVVVDLWVDERVYADNPRLALLVADILHDGGDTTDSWRAVTLRFSATPRKELTSMSV